MKYKFTILLILFSLQGSFGQDGLLNKKYFILEKDKNSISLNRFYNNEIIEHRNYQLSDSSLYATDGISKIAILDVEDMKLRIYDILTQTESTHKVPYKIKPLTIFINSNNVLIGGELENEMMVQWNLKNQKWHSLEIPTDILFPGKAIDDIVICNDTIYAVDNIILPKYILLYLDDETDKCKYLSKIDLKSNGAYESIRQARITSKYLGLISDTYSGWVGEGYHITIYDRSDFTKSFTLSIDREDAYSIIDFVIVNDELVILSKEKGVGKFSIKHSFLKTDEKYPDSNFNVRIKESKIRFDNSNNKDIIALTLIPETDKIVLTELKDVGIYIHEIIER